MKGILLWMLLIYNISYPFGLKLRSLINQTDNDLKVAIYTIGEKTKPRIIKLPKEKTTTLSNYFFITKEGPVLGYSILNKQINGPFSKLQLEYNGLVVLGDDKDGLVTDCAPTYQTTLYKDGKLLYKILSSPRQSGNIDITISNDSIKVSGGVKIVE